MTNLARQCTRFVLTSVLAGCGNDSEPADPSKFVGTWHAQSANLIVTCSNHRVQTIPVTDPTIFALGTTSDLFDSGPVCPLLYDLSGHTATAVPGQSCDYPMVITKLHVDADTFVTTDGVTGTHDASGHLDGYIDISEGNSVTCTWTETGAYQRAAS